ncbi:MAG: Na+/H+ antiporter subunit E [Gammaproteobacteria bacterium]
MTGSSSSDGATSSLREMAGRATALAVVLAATWLLWSGLYKPLLLALGAFSCALVVYLGWRMHLFDYSVFSFRYVWRLLGYWAWLGKEIFRSSLQVSRAVLSPDMAISPTVAELDAKSRHPVDIATLGNCITLTPGTLTIRIRDGRLIVHALMREGADEVTGGEMNRRVARLRER